MLDKHEILHKSICQAENKTFGILALLIRVVQASRPLSYVAREPAEPRREPEQCGSALIADLQASSRSDDHDLKLEEASLQVGAYPDRWKPPFGMVGCPSSMFKFLNEPTETPQPLCDLVEVSQHVDAGRGHDARQEQDYAVAAHGAAPKALRCARTEVGRHLG